MYYSNPNNNEHSSFFSPLNVFNYILLYWQWGFITETFNSKIIAYISKNYRIMSMERDKIRNKISFVG